MEEDARFEKGARVYKRERDTRRDDAYLRAGR